LVGNKKGCKFAAPFLMKGYRGERKGGLKETLFDVLEKKKKT
jgi:hypothetical protein